MRVLLIKTSSLGDIIHTLPALTDAQEKIPGIQFDWIVEETFQAIPALHPAVGKVIPIALRRWRKGLLQPANRRALVEFVKTLRESSYDAVIDAQGLLKSAWISLLAKGPSYGLGWSSAREALACLFYQNKLTVNFHQHAITRMREIFAKALHYPNPTNAPSGLNKTLFPRPASYADKNYMMCLPHTTWLNKQWPLDYWQTLIQELAQRNIYVLIPWGSAKEKVYAEAMQQNFATVCVLPHLDLKALASYVAHAESVIAVDSGLGHLAAALEVPSISLYGPTDAALTGTVGPQQWHLQAQFSCAPCLQKKCHYEGPIKNPFPACFSTITPDTIIAELKRHHLIHD